MNRQALQDAIDNLSIAMVYLRSTNALIYNGFDPLIANQELIGQFNISTKSFSYKEIQDELGNKNKVLIYNTEARMRYIKGPFSDDLKESADTGDISSELIAAEIVAEFTSEYFIKNNNELASEAVLEFGRVNVPHQVWPYWREYCHSTCSRMSLPVTILPMFAINKSIDEDRQ